MRYRTAVDESELGNESLNHAQAFRIPESLESFGQNVDICRVNGRIVDSDWPRKVHRIQWNQFIFGCGFLALGRQLLAWSSDGVALSSFEHRNPEAGCFYGFCCLRTPRLDTVVLATDCSA